MAMQRRASGVFVEARGGAAVAPGALRVRRARFGELAPPAPPAKGRRRAAAAPAAAPMTEEEAVVHAMEAQDLELLDAIPVTPAAAPARRRRGPAEVAVAPGAAGEVELAVPLAEGESAVVLVDHDGFYEWRLPDTSRAPAAGEAQAQPSRRRGAAAERPRAAAAPARTAVFRIAVRAAPPPPAQAAPRRAGRRRGLVTRVALGQAVAYVFRFFAKPVVQGIARFLERNVKEGLVHITAPDPQAWTTLADDAPLATPADRPARMLLLVHGTFSSTIGSFGALAGQAEGRSFLEEALRRYDLVLGWDHRTLGALPSDNAIDLASRLERIGFAQPVSIDAVCFSRGGLVLRSLIEHVIPSLPLQLQVRRAVFVAATNGGTELANPKNWHRLADRYTNLAAAGARAAALVPAFTAAGTLLAEGIRGVGVLVKVLASTAVTDRAVPGLAAMEPEGDFVRELNGAQPGQPSPEQAYYCAITSDFDPDRAAAEADPEVLPPLLVRTLADKGADALFQQPNDLVVDLASMTRIDPSVGTYIRERFDYGTNATVFHCSYFSQPRTAQRLAQWLELKPAAAAPGPVVRAGLPPRRTLAQILKLRSTQPVEVALKRMETVHKPWVVVERPFTQGGKPVTLRYAHPAPLAEQWLKEARTLPGATVHDAFELRESRVSHEVPLGAPREGGSAGAIVPELGGKWSSEFRTIEMERGEPVNVVSPGPPPEAAAPMAGAEPPTAARRRGQRARPPAAPPAGRPAAKKTAGAPAPAPQPQVECHFRAETDDEYVVGQVHTVDVTIAREVLRATRKASQGATAKVRTAKPLVVECMPMLRVSLRDAADARVEIPVPDAGTPAELRFDLVANEEGAGQVRVQVRQGPLPLVTLTLDFGVVGARTGTRRPVQAAADLAQFPELPRATDELRILQLQPYGGKTQYRYELDLPSLRLRRPPFESPPLDADPASYVAAIHKRIEDRWAEHASEKQAFARDLRAIGCELFDELLPLELKQLLWQHRGAIRSVQVLSSEPFIPWELLLVHDPAERRPGPDAAFLGELGVVRWLVNGYPPETLRLRKGKARYVVPDYPPPNALPGAQQEIAMVKKRFGATEVKPEAEAIYALLERPGQFDLLHVACHGATDAADIGSARLEMPGKPRSDGSLSEEDVLATTVRHEAELHAGDAQPMVVLNACQSARAGATLHGLGGFAEAFIEAGAGAFVGSSWSIGDAPAFAFVDALYENLLEGRQPLAAAAAAARRKARDDGDATWLAYVVYGHPRATVSRG